MSASERPDDFVFNRIKDKISQIDPVAFCERYLTLDGKPYRLSSSGYRPYTEIFRYIGIKALEKNSKPIVILKSRQSAATTMASALEMYFMGCGLFGVDDKPPIRIIHAFPQLDLAFSYSKVKLNNMISASVSANDELLPKGQKSKSHMQALLDTDSPTNDSLQFKQFKGGNHIFIESTGIDGARFRGKTADIIFYDEIQDMSAAAISNAAKVLNRAQYGNTGSGVSVFFGTPKQAGSVFYDIWNKSSQQFYYLGCEKCREYFPLYTPGSNSWEDTWLYGMTVRCTHCGCEQDKMEAQQRGKWVATRDPNECPYVGYFINQIFLPGITKEKVIAEKPGISPINTERAYQNEVLGEFFHGEAAIITMDQIRDLCGDPERKFRSSSIATEDAPVFLGIDIGAKNDLEQLVDSDRSKAQGQSYSTAVVLAPTGPTRLEIVFATKFKRNDPESKKGLIREIIRKYQCNLTICDIGFAEDLNHDLQTEYGGKFLSSRASNKIVNHIKYDEDIFPKIITFERDFHIAQLFEQMKRGNIRFPLGDYEKVAWLMTQCTNMEIKPSISRTGEINAHYIKSGPNDGFMALLNAYLAYKFYISNGFKIQVGANNTVKKEQALIITGYVPKMR
jgi:hypothetical protein